MSVLISTASGMSLGQQPLPQSELDGRIALLDSWRG